MLAPEKGRKQKKNSSAETQTEQLPSCDRAKYEIHEVANLLPDMSTEEYNNLRADIQRQGLLEPIWTYQGKIIDGRHRYRACEQLQIPLPPPREYEGDEKDLVPFVVGLNMNRRHLNESQRALVADQIAKHFESAKLHSVDTLDAAAKMVNVSRRSVATARKVRKECIPEVHEAVKSGKIRVSDAASLARKPEEKQRDAISRVLSGKAKTVKQAKRDPNDFYPTPAWVTKQLLQALPPKDNKVIEPAAGDGDIVAVLVEYGLEVDAIERRGECEETLKKSGAQNVQVGNALEVLPKSTSKAIIGNPPFEGDLGFQFVKACIATEAPYVAMLLQLDFLSSRDRAVWNNEHPVTALLPLGDRPSFTGDGKTDGRNYGWFVWITGGDPMPPTVLLNPEKVPKPKTQKGGKSTPGKKGRKTRPEKKQATSAKQDKGESK